MATGRRIEKAVQGERSWVVRRADVYAAAQAIVAYLESEEESEERSEGILIDVIENVFTERQQQGLRDRN